MYLNILKKDMKRKRTMNIILLLFIILAVMFSAGGFNNVLTVINGTDYYLDKAGVGDQVAVVMGGSAGGLGNALDNVLDNAPHVDSYRTESCFFGNRGNLSLPDGSRPETKNDPLFQSFDNTRLTFFDADNSPITGVKEGEVYIAGNFMRNNGLSAGDTIVISFGGVSAPFVIAGKAKDALFGSDIFGNTRFLMNNADYSRFAETEAVRENKLAEIAYIETDDPSAVSSAISDVPGLVFEGDRGTLKLTYAMDMIAAFVVLILSVCLIVISFVVLRFSIGFTIAEEYREIGVMKAIGLKSGRIRGLYIVKYLIMAAVGGGIGFGASIPFGSLLLRSAADNMVLGNDAGILVNLLSALGTAAVILLFAFGCTGRVKKMTPVDAIRSGQTGERFRKKSVLHLGRTKAKPAFFMAVNDILSAPKRFLAVMISVFICTLFVLILVNTTSTINSENLISLLRTKTAADLYAENNEVYDAVRKTADKKEAEEIVRGIAEKLTAEGMPCEVGMDIQYKYKVVAKGRDHSVTCAQGVNIGAAEYEYYAGSAPQSRSEIALTPQLSEKLGVKIGDTVIIDFRTEQVECMVTGYFQTMNQLGDLIRLGDDAPANPAEITSTLQLQLNFTDAPTAEEIESRRERIKELFGTGNVFDAEGLCVDSFSVVPAIMALQHLLLGITLIVVILVTVLVEHSFISDEGSRIAILKAMGFRTVHIVQWHTARFGIAALAAVILAAVLSIPMTELCASPIFGSVGAVDVDFNIDPLKIFLLYPAVIFAAAVITAWLTSLYTATIKVSEVTNIE